MALVDDEGATVKRFFRESGRIRLQPENDDDGVDLPRRGRDPGLGQSGDEAAVSPSISPLATGQRSRMSCSWRSRQPQPGPRHLAHCLVCSESMRVDEIAPEVLELTCDACGSSLSEDADPPVELRLVS